jgi:DNA-binding MarR family transcriptional regulator
MFDQCLYFNTTSLARQLEREWTLAFKPYGLTPSQAFMLRVILAKAPIAYTSLAAELNITKATCSRTVEGLCKLNMVQRVQADADARSFELVPTTAARSIHEQLDQSSASVTRKIKKIIGDQQFNSVVSTLRSISTSIT